MNGLCLDIHENMKKIINYIPISFHYKGQCQRLWDYNPRFQLRISLQLQHPWHYPTFVRSSTGVLGNQELGEVNKVSRGKIHNQ
jgi:hypothetical protein